MQNAKWIRFGLAAFILAGGLGGLTAVGCSGDDNVAGSDGGKTDGTTGFDSGNTDDGGGTGDSGTGSDASDASTVPFAKAYLVHASSFAPPLRFCFGLGDPTTGTVSVVPKPALPDTPIPGFPVPGLYQGMGGPIDTFGVNPAKLTLSVYAIDATTIATDVSGSSSERMCDALLGSTAMGADGGVPAGSFWYLGTIQKNTLIEGTTWVAAVTGCQQGADPATGLVKCLPNYDGGADLAVKMWQVDNTTAIDGGAMGVQFIQASIAWDGVTQYPPPNGLGAAATVLGAFEPAAAVPSDAGAGDAGDAAVTPSGPTTIPLVGDAKFGDLKPAMLAAVPGLTFDMMSGVFALPIDADGGPVTQPAAYPFPYVQAMTGLGDAGAFQNGTGFVFVLVGDPQQPTYINPQDGGAGDPDAGGVFNIAYPHFLGFPTANK